jgi:multiple sugar transport system substrate-binding protein
MRKPFKLTTLAAIAVVAVVGCSSTTATATPVPATQAPGTIAPGASAAATPYSAGVDDGTRISVWTRASTQSQAQELVAAYNATHKNQVDLTVVPNDNMQTKVGAAAGSGSLPDIISGDVAFMPNWAGQGLFTDLTAKIAALPFAKSLTQGPIAASTVAGKEYGLPFILDLSVWVYNKDLFTKAGITTPPTTLTEFAADADKVQALNISGTYGTEIAGECFGCEVFTWWPSIWADGGQVMNADGSAATLNTDEAKKVYSLYAGMVKDTAPGDKSEAGATWIAGFEAGKVGIQSFPGSALPAIPSSVNYGVVPIAGVTAGGQSTFVGGDGIGITNTSKHVDQAWNFLSWTLGDYAQTEIVAKGGNFPVRSDLATNSYSSALTYNSAISGVFPKGVTPLAKNFGSAFNDPNGPWGVLTRDVLYGSGPDSSKLGSENDAITKVLAGN